MKLISLLTIILFLLLLSPNLVLAQPDTLENPDRPYMIDGEGNGVNPGDNKKTSNEILEDFLNIFFKRTTKKKNNNSNTNNTNLPSTEPSPSIYITSPTNLDEIPSVPTNSDERSFANIINNLIHQDCISDGEGIVHKKNTILSMSLFKRPSCLTRVQGVMNAAGVTEMTNSVSAYYYLQCVACARAMAAARNRPLNGTGNAKNYIDQTVSGYRYIANTGINGNELTPGSVGISNEGTYGHIYYITEVYRDTNGRVTHYLALECNWGAQGYVRHDKKRALTQLIKGTNSFYLAGWQKPN